MLGAPRVHMSASREIGPATLATVMGGGTDRSNHGFVSPIEDPTRERCLTWATAGAHVNEGNRLLHNGGAPSRFEQDLADEFLKCFGKPLDASP
jgi:hypothetical protein